MHNLQKFSLIMQSLQAGMHNVHKQYEFTVSMHAVSYNN